VADFALAEITDIVERMDVYPDRMRRNMDRSFGLHASQHVLLALIESGMSRDDAYRIVQSAAMKAWDQERPYLEVLKEDSRATEVLPGPRLDELFDERRYIANLDVVFDRLASLDA
jgi:adenylosuccinate lyase